MKLDVDLIRTLCRTRACSQLFELLAMCGMLMDFNWTEILKRREILRLDFA